MYKFFCLLFLSTAIFAADVATIHTIAILKMGDEPTIENFPKGVWIDPCLDFPDCEKRVQQILSPYLQTPITDQDLEKIEQIVLSRFERKHRPIVSVIIPPQDLSEGVLRILVLEPIVGSIRLCGNRWTSDQFILKGSGLCEGATLNSYDLQNQIAWINRSPFRRTNIVLVAGDQPGTTNAELITQERFPFRVYAGADNTGTVYLRHTRIYAGFNAGNLWGLDHQTSFQWTTAPNPDTLTAFSGQYIAPFPWHHQLLFYGGYSKFKGDIPVDLMSQHGKAWQVSGRYQIPIHPIFGGALQQVSIGYDFKRTNSELIFGGIPFQGAYADINQFYFGYNLDYPTCDSKTSLVAEIIAAPFHITHDQNNRAYQTLRPDAESEYVYARMRFSYSKNFFHGCAFRMNVAGQLASTNLLASEQFPLGGYETVRGYEERAFNADSGVLGSVELATPNMGYFEGHSLELLGFFDCGWGTLHEKYLEQKESQWLAGVGPAIRYRYLSNVVLRGDIGFPLHKAGVPRHGTHYYGGATVSY